MDKCFPQKDNAQFFAAASVKYHYQDVNVKLLPRSTQSPDLNHIEHLSDELERYLRTGEPRLKCTAELETFLLQKWTLIQAAVYQNLVEGMPRRTASVMVAHGELSPY